MTTEQLKNFLVVAETLNFRKSTEKIYIAQPALSRQIQLLEQEIGAILFDRSKKQIKLTTAGCFFKKEAQRIISQLEEAIHKAGQVHRGESGEIKVGHASSAMQSVLPGFLKKIQENYTDLKISLTEGTNRFIFDKLTNRELDFGIVPNATVPSPFASWVVYKENFVLITPETYNPNSKSFKSIRDYAKENWILPPKEEGHGYVEYLHRIFQRYGFTPHVVFESPNSSTVLRLVGAGLGLTIISKSSLNNLNLNIKYKELKEIPEKVEMRMVWLKERDDELQPHINRFKKYLGSKS